MCLPNFHTVLGTLTDRVDFDHSSSLPDTRTVTNLLPLSTTILTSITEWWPNYESSLWVKLLRVQLRQPGWRSMSFHSNLSECTFVNRGPYPLTPKKQSLLLIDFRGLVIPPIITEDKASPFGRMWSPYLVSIVLITDTSGMRCRWRREQHFHVATFVKDLWKR
jgi:hypothetical protein